MITRPAVVAVSMRASWLPVRNGCILVTVMFLTPTAK
jgi:hypothetical protein